MAETFVSVRGYPDYQVSNLGRVISNKKGLKFMKLSVSNSGYLRVNISSLGKPRTFGIHRLIAMHFLPVPDDEESLVVDHINRDKTDNRVENLRWTTQSENNTNKDVYGGISRRKDGLWQVSYNLENGTQVLKRFGKKREYDAIEHLSMMQLLYNRSYDLI